MQVLDELTKKVRESGRATRTVEYVDDQRIRIASGEHRAKRVVVRFNAKLRGARVKNESTFWVVPDIGVVAADHEERVTVLGAFTMKHQRTMTVLKQ